jgi:hypothetical protein
VRPRTPREGSRHATRHRRAPNAQGEHTAALAAFRLAHSKQHNGRRNQAPQLAMAAVHFNQGNIAAALKLCVLGARARVCGGLLQWLCACCAGWAVHTRALVLAVA